MVQNWVEFWVEGLPKSPNQTSGKHWSSLYKEKQKWQLAAAYSVARYWDKPLLEKASIHFEISTGDNRRHDPDNLAWAVTKPTLDGLKGVVLVDDSIDNVTLSYSYNRNKPRGYKVTVQST